MRRWISCDPSVDAALAASRSVRVCVLRGSIAYSAVTQPLTGPLAERRHALLDGGGAEHAGLAHGDQRAALGVRERVEFDGRRSQVAGGSLIWAHGPECIDCSCRRRRISA